MTRKIFRELLLGKQRPEKETVVEQAVYDQKTFDELFPLTLTSEHIIAERAVDVVEKITERHPEYLDPHKHQLFSVLKGADHKELKQHITHLIPRLALTAQERIELWNILSHRARNRNENKTVRVNSLQGLYDLAGDDPQLKASLLEVMSPMEKEMISSISARVKKLKAML